MKYYGNDILTPGTAQPPDVRTAPKPAPALPGIKPPRHRRVEKVVDGAVADTFATVISAAAAALVSKATMSRWIQCKKINRGAVWRYERD